MNKINNGLTGLPVFEGLDQNELEEIANICSIKHFSKGERILEDNQIGNDLYVVLRGDVSVKLESITPNYDITISTIGPRQIFGEMTLIDQEPRSATVTCNEDTEVIIIDGTKLKNLFSKNYRVGFVVMTNIAKIICLRIRKTNRKLLNLMRISLF